MSTNNEATEEAQIRKSMASAKAKRRRSSESYGNNLLEGFRGFGKMPRVVLTRYDIKPYLNNLYTYRNERLKQMDVFEASLHKKRLAQKCCVNVVNHNLEKLKSNFLSQRTGNISTGLLSDPIDGDMTEAIKCKFCEKSYFSEKKLIKHQETKHTIVYKSDNKTQKRVSFSDHVIIHEVKEYHKCRKCPDMFEEYENLKKHMKQFHKKRKCYVCHYCSKDFADRAFFKNHIKLHCNTCRSIFPNKTKVNEHKVSCKPLHTCVTCNESYFSLIDLKDHLYEHSCVGYVCSVCKNQFQSKCLLTHHIVFLHSNDRPKSLYTIANFTYNTLYSCNFCDKTSVKENLIQLHVQSLPVLFTKAMRDFACDICSKKFDTEANMLEHKWSHFLKANNSSLIEENTFIKKHSSNGNMQFKEPRVILEKLNTSRYILPGGVVDEIERDFSKSELNTAVDSKMREKSPDNQMIGGTLTEQVTEETLGDQKTDNIPGDQKTDNTPGDQKTDKTPGDQMTDEIHGDQKTDEASNDQVAEEFDYSKTINKAQKKTAIDEPKLKKRIVLKHQCENCGKYLSSRSSLKRHIAKLHLDFSSLQCKVCEETFVWPSLLKTHKCIRISRPEMPFEDARPEIQFDNLNEIYQHGFDEFNISDDNYMNRVDFDIPEPIEDRTDHDHNLFTQNQDRFAPLSNLGYKIITQQEVPIEF